MRKLLHILLLLLLSFSASAKMPFGFFKPASAGGGATNPGTVANLDQWLDVNALTALSDGDPVTTIADASGLGHTATSSGSFRALYKTNILNSKPVLRFDGSDDFYNFTASNAGTELTFFVVFKSLGGAAPRRPIYDYVNSDGSHQFSVIVETGGTLRAHCYNSTGGGYQFLFSGITIGTSAFHYLTVFYGSNDARLRLDGVETSTDSSVSVNSYTIDASKCEIGQDAFASHVFYGDIAEIIKYDRKLTSGEITGIEAYLAAKYGL